MVVFEKKVRGLTLIETAVAIAVIAIAALGSLSYQYYGAEHVRIAQADLTATRIGQLLLEDWKSTGLSTYDPTTINTALDTTLGIGFTNTTSYYVIKVDGITLSIDKPLTRTVAPIGNNPDPSGYAGTVYQRSVTVRWRNDFGAGDPLVNGRSLVFTTYASK